MRETIYYTTDGGQTVQRAENATPQDVLDDIYGQDADDKRALGLVVADVGFVDSAPAGHTIDGLAAGWDAATGTSVLLCDGVPVQLLGPGQHDHGDLLIAVPTVRIYAAFCDGTEK